MLQIAAILVSAGCSPAPASSMIPGHSNRPRGGATVPAKEAPDAGPTRWERWSEVATYRLAVARAPSQHLAGDHEGEVLANASAAAYPDLGPARPLATGSVLVQRLYGAGAATPDVVFAMVKRPLEPAISPTAVAGGSAAPSTEVPLGGEPGGAWEFLVLDVDGMIESRGPLELCARCHAEAPHEGVFGRAQ